MSYDQNSDTSQFDNTTNPGASYDEDTNLTGSGTDSGNYGKSEMFDTRRQGQTRRSDLADASYGGPDATGYGGATSAGMRGSSLDDDSGNRAYDTRTGGYPPGRGIGVTQPTMGDKVKGQMEKMAGKIVDDPAMVERGQERKTGTGGGSTY